SYGESFRDAEEIKPCQSKYNSDPDIQSAPFLKEESDNRYDDNVKGSDKSCLSYCCMQNSDLLKAAGYSEGCSAADTADQQCFLICLFLCLILADLLFFQIRIYFI